MAIAAECGNCKKRYSVDDRMAGKRVKCKQCGTVFTVPGELAAGASLAGGTLSGTVAGRSASVAGATPTSRTPAMPPPPPAPRAEDPPDIDALFSLGEGAAGPVPMAPPPMPPAGGAPFMPAPAMAAPMAMPAQPPGVAYFTPAPVRKKKITAVGVDNATPWMIICYVVANIALLVYLLVQWPKGTATVAVTMVTTIIVSLFAVIGPLVLLGVFIGSKILNFQLQDAAYLRSCGIGAIPGVMMSLVILVAVTSGNPVVILLLIFATLPLFFYVLMMSFDLTWPEAAVSFAFSIVFYGIAQFISFLLITAVAAGAAMGTPIRGGRDRDDSEIAEVDQRPQTPSQTPAQDPTPRPSPVDPLALEMKGLRDRVLSLHSRNVTGRSREAMMGEWRSMKLLVDAARPRLDKRAEWSEVIDLLASTEKKFQELPSENPDPSLYQDPQPTENWEATAAELANLGAEISYKSYRLRPPLEAPIDLSRGAGADPQSLLWRYRKGGRGTLAVSVVPRTEPRQRRPWVATQDFMKDSATRGKLFAVDAVGAAPQVSYGRIGGMLFTRVASNPSAGVFVQRWVKYVALDGNNWLVVEAQGDRDDSLAADLMETAARTLRKAQAGEAKADPFAPALVAPRLADAPEHAAAILRRHGAAAAEASVIAQLDSPNTTARREAAKLLLDLGTAAAVPALEMAAAADDDEVRKAARAALAKVAPGKFDAVSAALLDVKDERGWRKKEALEALAAATPDAARRPQVATLLEDMLLSEKTGFDAEQVGKALGVWHGPNTVTRVSPILREEHGSPWKRHGAIAALAGTRDKRAAAVILLWTIKEPKHVVDAIIRIGPAAEDEILRLNLLRNPDAKVRTSAATMLEQMGTAKCYQELLRASKDSRDAAAAGVAQQALEAVKARMNAAKPATKPAA